MILTFFGYFFDIALLLFLVLKTFADVVMHLIEHNVLRKGELQKTQELNDIQINP
jgi:hypothetical protein